MPKKTAKKVSSTKRLPNLVPANSFVSASVLSYIACAIIGIILLSNFNFLAPMGYFYFFWYGYLVVSGILFLGMSLISKKVKDRLLFLIFSLGFIFCLAMIPVPPGMISLIGPLVVVIIRVLQLKN